MYAAQVRVLACCQFCHVSLPISCLYTANTAIMSKNIFVYNCLIPQCWNRRFTDLKKFFSKALRCFTRFAALLFMCSAAREGRGCVCWRGQCWFINCWRWVSNLIVNFSINLNPSINYLTSVLDSHAASSTEKHTNKKGNYCCICRFLVSTLSFGSIPSKVLLNSAEMICEERELILNVIPLIDFNKVWQQKSNCLLLKMHLLEYFAK